GDDLWVSLSRGGGLVRFDARTGAVVAQIAVEARSLLATSSSVWVSDRKTPNSDSFVLQRLSTSTNSVVGTPISLPSGYGPIAIDEGGVWLDGYDPQEQVSLI